MATSPYIRRYYIPYWFFPRYTWESLYIKGERLFHNNFEGGSFLHFIRRRVFWMTTKQDYKSALGRVLKLAGMTFDDEEHANFIFGKTMACDYETIKSALELALKILPQPIGEAPRTGEQFLVTDGECIVMAEWGNKEIDIFDCTSHEAFSDKNKATHFYDLSTLPRPHG